MEASRAFIKFIGTASTGQRHRHRVETLILKVIVASDGMKIDLEEIGR